MTKIEVPAYLFRGTAVVIDKVHIKNATDSEFEHVNLYITRDEAEHLMNLAEKAQKVADTEETP